MAERCTEQMLKAGAECIVCMDDNICLNVLNALRKFEVRIPEDILVASFTTVACWRNTTRRSAA